MAKEMPIVFLCILISFLLMACQKIQSKPVNAENSYGSGQSIKHTVGGRDFTWQFSCNGGDCLIGNFMGGDYWIAPKHVNENVTIHAVTPEGEENGMMANPGSSPEQGFLKCDEKVLKFYKSSVNLMTSLPSVIKTETSLVKAAKRSPDQSCWGKNNKHHCCVDAYDVVTILKKPLENSKYFRPGFAGDEKKLYQLSDLDLNKIPIIKEVSMFENRPSFEKTHERWHSPYVDHYLSFMGDTGRAFAPNNVIPNYGAEQNRLYLDDLINVMGPEPIEKKMPAVTGLLQRGLDLYTSMQTGVKWPGGAGQSMGRKPPMVFFSTLVNDNNVKNIVKDMANNTVIKNTQEDVQIRTVEKIDGGSGSPIWGNVGGFCNENFYWSQLFVSQQYDGGSKIPIDSGDNKKTCGDPYGWIDGPAGLPGSAYMECCSTGGFIEYAFTLKLMPAMCETAEASRLIRYVNRVLTHGILTQPDICAPPDPKESKDCKPFKKGAPGCLYFGKTWGANPSQPGRCILNNMNQKGRFSKLDGSKLLNIHNEGSLSKFLRGYLNINVINACGIQHQ